MIPTRKTEQQAHDAAQARLQREGYVIAYIATTLRLVGAVGTKDQIRAEVEAKARFPIRGLRRRIVTRDDFEYQVSEDGKQLLFRIPAEYLEEPESWLPYRATVTPDLVSFAHALFHTPDEVYVTDE